MTRKQPKNKYFRLRLYTFLALSTLIILIGGSAALLWQIRQEQHTQAAASIVGPPSLPATTVDSILARVGSPMVGTGKVIEEASRQTNIDDAFALSVWWAETNDGAAGVGRADRNPGSVRGSAGFPRAFDGYTIYPSYEAAITDWFNLMANRYVSRGLTTVYSICGPYVATSSCSQPGGWSAKVMSKMMQYRLLAPPPTPTPPPSAKLVDQKRSTDHITQGISIELSRPAGYVVRHPVTEEKPSSFSTSAQALFTLAGLLVALVVALWGWKVRQNLPPMPEEEQGLARPVVTTEELSPIILEQSPSIEPGAIPFPPFEKEILPQPVMGSIAATPVPAGGLLRRYQQSSVIPARPASIMSKNTEDLVEVQQFNGRPVAESFYPPQLLVPIPVPVGSRAGQGMLSRYEEDRTSS